MCLLTIGTAKQEEEEEKDAFAAAGIRRGQNPKEGAGAHGETIRKILS